jgi:hypothetical protein
MLDVGRQLRDRSPGVGATPKCARFNPEDPRGCKLELAGITPPSALRYRWYSLVSIPVGTTQTGIRYSLFRGIPIPMAV